MCIQKHCQHSTFPEFNKITGILGGIRTHDLCNARADVWLLYDILSVVIYFKQRYYWNSEILVCLFFFPTADPCWINEENTTICGIYGECVRHGALQPGTAATVILQSSCICQAGYNTIKDNVECKSQFKNTHTKANKQTNKRTN